MSADLLDLSGSSALTKAAGGYPITPAVAAGIEQRVWTHTDIAALLD